MSLRGFWRARREGGSEVMVEVEVFSGGVDLGVELGCGCG